MKNELNKHLLILGFTTILGIILLLVGVVFTESFDQTDDWKKAAINGSNIAVVESVPTEKDLLKKDRKKATVYNRTKKEMITAKKDTADPVINAPAETVYQGEGVNIYDGVTATDNIDGDITSKLVAENELDTTTPGTFTVKFSVSDASGNIGTTDRIFYVIENDSQTQPVVDNSSIEMSLETQTAPIPAMYAPMTLTMNGTVIPYQNGGQESGQSIIDANPNGVASTWGGAPVQSGEDGLNTHFIGHNPGIFSAMFSLNIGSELVVTDATGTATTYTVQSLLQLDDYGNEVGTGTNYFDFVTGTGGGERISLQSCINNDTNLFAIAYKVSS